MSDISSIGASVFCLVIADPYITYCIRPIADMDGHIILKESFLNASSSSEDSKSVNSYSMQNMLHRSYYCNARLLCLIQIFVINIIINL